MTHGDEAAASIADTAGPSHRRRQLMGASLAGLGSLVFDLAAPGQAQRAQTSNRACQCLGGRGSMRGQ